MSVDGVELSDDFGEARTQEADIRQAQYFHRVLGSECDVVRSNLAVHAALLTEAQLGGDQFLMRYQRRLVRKLESEDRKLIAMRSAIESRFHVAED